MGVISMEEEHKALDDELTEKRLEQDYLSQAELQEKKLEEDELEKEELEKKEEPKKIEVVTGDGEDLNISPVYEHLEVEKPRPKENRQIIIPEVKENINRKQESTEDSKE